MNDSKYAEANGVSDLAGATCTSQINTVWYDYAFRRSRRQYPARDGKRPDNACRANSGKADLVITDMPTAKAAIIVYPI
jgi:putative lysine transport system substrate-binding protein